jgi:hypothetical protein
MINLNKKLILIYFAFIKITLSSVENTQNLIENDFQELYHSENFKNENENFKPFYHDLHIKERFLQGAYKHKPIFGN